MTLRHAPAWRGKFRVAAAAAIAIAMVGLAGPLHVTRDAIASEKLVPWRSGSLPSFELARIGGPAIPLESLRGRVVLVHFFATWCEPCKEELPALRRLVERADSERITVLAISVAEVAPRVERFLATMPLNFPVLLDQDRAVAKAWRISSLPSTVVLGPDLVPKLVVEADYPWDTVEPSELARKAAAPAR
jgi:peroxiredoxin